MRGYAAIGTILLCTIALGQDDDGLVAKYRKELQANPRNSVTHFRMGEIYFQRGEFQPAANAFREALNGGVEPKWIEVWSFLNLGKIFDITGQRERAVNAYAQAVRTKDNTRGAVDEAEIYLKTHIRANNFRTKCRPESSPGHFPKAPFSNRYRKVRDALLNLERH